MYIQLQSEEMNLYLLLLYAVMHFGHMYVQLALYMYFSYISFVTFLYLYLHGCEFNYRFVYMEKSCVYGGSVGDPKKSWNSGRNKWNKI